MAISLYTCLGHLIKDVKLAPRELGQRIVSVDMQDEHRFSFRVVNDDGTETGLGWAIRLADVQRRNLWDIDDEDLRDAIHKLLPVPGTRALMARWLSQEITLEDAVAMASRTAAPEPS